MQKQEKPISIWWLVPYLLIFGASIIYFFFKSFQNIENVLGLFIFSLLLIFFLFIYAKFSLLFGEKGLVVKEAFRKDFIIPYDKIVGQYIRQTPFQRSLGLQNLIIRFESEKQRERISVKAFGFSYQYYGLIHFPGVWGELLTVPNVNKKNLELLKRELQKRSQISISNIGIGYPIYGNLVKFRFTLSWVLVLFLIFIGVFFIILKGLLLLTP